MQFVGACNDHLPMPSFLHGQGLAQRQTSPVIMASLHIRCMRKSVTYWQAHSALVACVCFGNAGRTPNDWQDALESHTADITRSLTGAQPKSAAAESWRAPAAAHVSITPADSAQSDASQEESDASQADVRPDKPTGMASAPASLLASVWALDPVCMQKQQS